MSTRHKYAIGQRVRKTLVPGGIFVVAGIMICDQGIFYSLNGVTEKSCPVARYDWVGEGELAEA
jgi:hypothetical protein